MTTLHRTLRTQGSDVELLRNLALAQLAVVVMALVCMVLITS